MVGLQSEGFDSAIISDQLLQLAVEAVSKNDLDAARAYCVQALADNPHDLDALLWRSALADDYQDKISSLEQVLKIDPDDRRAKMLMGWALSRQSRGEAPSVTSEINLLTPCPYLGTASDASSRFAYASPGNVCHAGATNRRLPREVQEDAQRDICLVAAHLGCPTYCRARSFLGETAHVNDPAVRDYFDFFGLDEEPFNIVPMTRFLYMTRQYENALGICERVIRHQQGLGVLSGPVGIGKTLLLRRLYEELFTSPYYVVGLLLHPDFHSEYAMMGTILQALRVHPQKRRSLLDLENAFQQFVLQQAVKEHKTVVLLIDEAQQMRPKALHFLRKIIDFQIDERQMVQVILAGVPHLLANLARLPALRDRVMGEASLGPLAPSEVKAFIEMRLREAGAQESFFTSDAVRAITDLSKGHPRRINAICTNCLWKAFQERRRSINFELVQRAIGNPPKEPIPAESSGRLGILARLQLVGQRAGLL